MIYELLMDSKVASRYEKLKKNRSPFLERGRSYSKLTLPYVLPQNAPSAGAQNKHGYQGIGAEAVNHLSNKVTSALFPVTEPFFRMDLDPDVEKELKDRKIDKTQLSTYFNGMVDLAMRNMTKLSVRPQIVSHEKHLIISGNSCMAFTDRGVKQLGLNNYVCKRDPEGNLLEAITLEEISLDMLPEAVRFAVTTYKMTNKPDDMDKLKYYTSYKRSSKGDEFVITEAVEEITVGSKTVPAEKLPIIISRWTATSGEDYGRGLVEDHAGDFHVLEFLSEARARGAATMMDVKFLVRPGSLTDVTTLNKAPTGEFVQGVEDDIHVLQLEKYADSTLIQSVMEEYQQRIGRAFLMLQTQVRDSERTTAYEIQKLANEIEMSLGGVYSTQAEEVQRPMAIQLLDMVDPRLVDKNFIPVISTGLEALGRAKELEKLMQYSELLALPASWPEPVQQRVKWDEYESFIASNLSISTGWLMTDAELQKQQSTQNNAGTDQAMGEAVAKGAGAAIGKRIGEGTS